MPIRRALNTAAEADGIAACVSAMYDYLRARDALSEGVSNWTRGTVVAWRQAGYEAFVYANSNAAGRIDGVCIYGRENHIRQPSIVPEPWMAVKVLAVRADLIPDDQHEVNTLRALKLAVPDGLTRLGCVGVMAMYHQRWQRLHDFLATWPTAEFELLERDERCWIRAQPGTPAFNERVAGVSG